MNIDKLLNETVLSGEDLVKIETDIKQHKWNYMKIHGEMISDDNEFKNAIIKIYKMRYKLNISVSDMAKYFGLDQRAIQCKLSKLGWQRTSYEAQAIASTKRNYKKIKSKSIETMIKRGSFVTGSEAENYIRQMINQLLTSQLDYEVIVGLNNRTILNGLEIDIPIVIIKNNQLIKYAIEVDGSFWHKDELTQKRKEEAILKTDYKYLKIVTYGSLKNSKSKINIEIDKVVNQIVEEVNNTSFFNAQKQVIT